MAEKQIKHHLVSNGDLQEQIPRLAELAIESSQTPSFGRAFRTHFNFAPTHTPLNHGAYGTAPEAVRVVQQQERLLSETRPDSFINETHPRKLEASRAAVANLLHCSPDSIVFVPNATTATNAVLRALVHKPGDVVLYFSPVYAALEKTMAYLVETTPLRMHLIDLIFPVSTAAVLSAFRDAVSSINASVLPDGTPRRAALAIFDTISSMPALRFPFEELTALCRELHVVSIIDGAHGAGQIPLDLATLDADYFTTNLHKWLFVPRSCAILYAPQRNQHFLRTGLPTSHSFAPALPPDASPLWNRPVPSAGRNAFHSLFHANGTMDNTTYLCVPAALAFRRDVCGGEACLMAYIERVAQTGADAAAIILGTEVMGTGSVRQCAMANVRLPVAVGNEPGMLTAEKEAAMVPWLVRLADRHFDTYIQMVKYGGKWWVRFSGMVYVEVADIIWAARMLKGLCDEIGRTDGLCLHWTDEECRQLCQRIKEEIGGRMPPDEVREVA